VEGIRTLHDLLRLIRPLKLQRYEGAQLQQACFLGEGVSYNVYQSTDTKSGSLVAVKKVKLPAAPANLVAFRSRIACILKDIKVMSHLPLAQHSNILNILGYGWESGGEGPLPFIVTECATLGTLREHLTKSTTNARRRRELCHQVASGLHELHLSGVAHGDLKLENVLVALAAADQVGPRRVPVVAKLSDFGHSLRFASGTNQSQQTYHGTLWYNPPEVVQHDTTVADVHPRKCDAWALGLLCWEVHKCGARYYDDEYMRELLSKTEPQSTSTSTNSDGHRNLDRESAEVLSKKLFNIGSLIAKEAHCWVDRVLIKDPEWPHFDRILLKGVFRNTLEVKLFLEDNISQIPMRVKVEMLEDFQRLASLPQGSLEVSARAALHVVFAHAASFANTALFTESVGFWIQKSAEGGLQIAILMKELLEIKLEEKNPPIQHEGPDGYNIAICLTIKALARSEFPTLIGIGPYSTFAALLNAVQSTGDQSLVAHYAVICQLTKVLPAEYVNIRSSKTGETALSLACRLGDHEAAEHLLDLGAEASTCTPDGCSALHWLFVFDKTRMREMAVRLQYLDAMNQIAKRPQLLDAQLPIDIYGTPLEFAVAAASMSAVEILIPFSLMNINTQFTSGLLVPSALKGAFSRATSLYLYEIFAKLREAYNPHASAFINLGDLAKSSLVIKKLIHGHRLSVALDIMLERLLSNLEGQPALVDKTGRALKMRIILGFQLAIQAGDMSLAQKLVKSVFTTENDLPLEPKTATTPKPDKCLTNEFKTTIASFQSRQVIANDTSSIRTSTMSSRGERKNATCLSLGSAVCLSCAEVACSSIYDLETSFEILRLSAYYGPKFDYMDTWLVSAITAVQQHREDIFRWLLQNPNDLDARTIEGATIIHTMLKYNFTNLVSLDIILSKGANPDLVDEFNNTPVHVTLQLGMAQELNTLLDYNASIFLEDRDGNRPLHAAIICGREDALSRLLQHPLRKIVVDEKDSEGRSPLALAALMGLPKVFEQLVESGANPGVLDQAGRAPIHLAASGSTSGHQLVLAIILALLLSMEQDVNILDDGGNTALHVSITSQALLANPTFDVCEQLLAAGADAQIRNNEGDLPIFLALRLLNLKLFSRLLPILLRNGADINARGSLSLSALHFAALNGEADLVLELIKHGALPNLSGNVDHGTPLHCCAEVSPATVEDERIRRTTFEPKMFSTVMRKETAARYLLDAGADIFAKFSSSEGRILEATPLDIALKVGIATVAITLIEEHYTRLGDILGALHFEVLQRAFDYAVRHQQFKIVHRFLLSKIPVDKSSLCNFGHGMKILAHAVYYDKSEILQCYKETQSRMIFLDRVPQNTNIPSLWAIIGKSGSKVLEAEVYLQLYSRIVRDSTGNRNPKIITIGLDLERIVSDTYRPSSWSEESWAKDLSSYYSRDGYPNISLAMALYLWNISDWNDGEALVKRRYLDAALEWLPDLGENIASSISNWLESGLLSHRG
ncbi:MAG: hypothetical protein Q9187_005183, partial [Circinaria calcarea]